MTDRQAKSVLLHEMIHYAIAYTGLRDTSSHGVVFRGMMDNLNRKYGWDIRVMTSTKGWKVSEQVKAKQTLRGPQTYLMLAIEMHDGKYYLSRVNPSFATGIERKIRGTPRSETSSVVYHPGSLIFVRFSSGEKPQRATHLKSRLF